MARPLPFTAQTTTNPASVRFGLPARTLEQAFAELVEQRMADVLSHDSADAVYDQMRAGLAALERGQNLTIGQVIAMWGTLRTAQIKARDDGDHDALFATGKVGAEFVAEKRRIDARRNRAFRALNAATGRDWRKDWD